MLNTDQLELMANQVADLSRQTGAFIENEARNFDQSVIEIKGKNDLVSYVDKEAEKKLVQGLQEIFPGSGFLTEEKTTTQIDAEFTWIIDPLDGTTNFIHGIPTYAVSIGLMINHKVVLGVVYEINRDELYKAWKGGGAYLNDVPIQVSNISNISESLFSTGFPIQKFDKLDEYFNILNSLIRNSHGIRRGGSAAVDLAYVACGRFQGFFESNLNPWDVAAGIILIQEAGGKISDFSGEDNYLFGKEIIGAGAVFNDFLAIIGTHWNKRQI